MKFSDVETYVTAGLTARNYGTAGHPAMPTFDPGPVNVDRVLKKSPNAMVFLNVGGGIGLAKEGLFDRRFITVRVVGEQNSYDAAETLAKDVDDIMLEADGNMTVGSAKTLFITRTGGAPNLVDLDSGERYHFQATYITEAQR